MLQWVPLYRLWQMKYQGILFLVLWDCAQVTLTLILSHTKIGKVYVIVGDENETVEAVRELIKAK